MKIVGVSFDTPEDNQDFIESEGFEYELWSDQARELALHYGAASSANQGFADRVTVLLAGDGTLLLEYSPGLDVATHPQLVLDDCIALWGDE